MDDVKDVNGNREIDIVKETKDRKDPYDGSHRNETAGMKYLFIAEKPSVARQFADALGMPSAGGGGRGFLESGKYVVTWCVGHLVTMSYPDKYDEKLRFWKVETLPFIPSDFKYEVIEDSKRQFAIVAGLLKRADVSRIYVCTDSGREGEYIYRLVDMMAGVKGKEKRRVWIDSQTRDEILRGIREAKPESDYDNLSAAAFSRAKEDYLMGINFSRALTLRFGKDISRQLGTEKRTVVSAGRVMTCVLGMVVKREEEIRAFRKTVFYKVLAGFRPLKAAGDMDASLSGPGGDYLKAEFRSCFGDTEESGGAAAGDKGAPPKGGSTGRYTPGDIYRNIGFLDKGKAEAFVQALSPLPGEAVVRSIEKKKETRNPPLLYNLAELQNDCSRLFKISPDETLKYAQELYEKKMTTYPRTDARVLSSAVAKEIEKNISGLGVLPQFQGFVKDILARGGHKGIGKTRYTDDSKITDHYAIIPTGQGIREFQRLAPLARSIYELIVRRFLSVFYPAAIFQKLALQIDFKGETFVSSSRVLKDEGYLAVASPQRTESRGKDSNGAEKAGTAGTAFPGEAGMDEALSSGIGAPAQADRKLSEMLSGLRKGQKLLITSLSLKEGETSPPKRYTSGTMILAMENAGNLIEDEELRAQIRSTGIGTSATRAGILTKLEKIGYVAVQKKTQALSPTRLGELVTKAVQSSVRQLLNPELTASWEKGLSYVAEGKITEAEYMQKLDSFVRSRTNAIIGKRK